MEKIKNKIKKDEFKGRKIINFINTYGVYHFIKTPEFYVSIKKSRQEVLNFIDSFSVAAILNGKRIRGPSFTKAMLQDRDIFENNKHFFIGFDEKDLDKISNKFNLKRENLFSHISIYTKTPRERE